MKNKSKVWLFLLPILVAFQIFTGYIPIVIYSYLICLFYILFFHFLIQLRKRKIFWKKFILLLLFWLWGFTLASVQLFPGYELIKNSIRSIDPIVSASNASYLPFENLITFIAPDFFGNPATGNYFGKAFYDNFYLFLGTGTLILIFYSLLFLKKEKDIQFWWLIFLFSLILVFKNPLGVFLEKILMLSGGVAARALFMSDFSLAILAAFGIEKFLGGSQKDRRKIFLAVFILFVLLMVAVLFSFQIENPPDRLVAQRNLILPFLFFVLTSLTLMGGYTIRLIRINLVKLAGTVCVFLVSVQLLYSAKKYLPFSKKELLFPTTPVIDFLRNEQKKNKEPFRVELGDVVPQNFLMPYGIEAVSGYDALLPQKTAEFLSLVQTGRIMERISRVHLITNYDSPLFPLLNVKYILAKKTDEKGYLSPSGKPPPIFLDPRFKLVFEDKTVQVYKDNEFLPRAFFQSSKSPVVWDEYWSGRMGFRVFLEAPDTLTVTSSNFPGWKAYIDGKEAEILQEKNFPFFKIFVPEGEHKIDLKYNPDSFKFGFFISGVSLAILLTTLSLIIFLQAH